MTTIISRFKPAGALIHWAWQCGINGLDYREEKDNAAEIGSLAHRMIEADIRGEHFPKICVDPEELKAARVAFGAYLTWKRAVKLRPAATEVSLVSEKYRYGGTFDALLIGEELTIADWKTSKRLYPDFIVQLAAYKQLYEENHPGQIIAGVHLIHFDKEYGNFKHLHFRNLERAWRAFELARELYALDSELSRMTSLAHSVGA